MRRARITTAVIDQEAEGNEEEDGSGNDEGFEVADFEDNKADEGADEDGCEAVKGGDAGGGFDGFVEANDEDGVEVVALEVPSCVQVDGDEESSPDSAVFEETERNHGMRGPSLP